MDGWARIQPSWYLWICAGPSMAGSLMEGSPVSIWPAKRRLKSAWPATRTLKSYQYALSCSGSTMRELAPGATRALRTASANHELSLVFQPFIEIATGRIVGMEALMRWDSPQFGPVSPNEFIPIAEESGLILSIGAWAIGEAIREASRWPANVRVGVNLSPLQFQTQSLVPTVARALREQQQSFLLLVQTLLQLGKLRFLSRDRRACALDLFGGSR